ncbi:MAG TPA: hypothetical protein VMU94_00455 [Streptosporangiaceae bacterium]|nr:hypothetical protein [Streptosporangiaceae bacterium]
MPDEERFAIVISIDHPQGDLAGTARADLSSSRVVDIYTVNLYHYAVRRALDGDIRLAEDHEQICASSLF